jgi:hypothetical protein
MGQLGEGVSKTSFKDNMEVNTSYGSSGVGGITPPNRSTPSAKPAGATDSFSRTSGLDQTLQSLPASRPDAVAYAKSLIADPGYPSADTMKQVSNLLAENLTSDSE